VSQSEAERLRFWSAAKRLSRHVSPDYMCMDSTIHASAHISASTAEMEKKAQLRCANVFHAGDGNGTLCSDANADQLHRCELFGADILKPAWLWAAP
jgi:glycolate oxidase